MAASREVCGREGERKRGKKGETGGREGGREGRKRGREGGRKGGREGCGRDEGGEEGREGRRERGRKAKVNVFKIGKPKRVWVHTNKPESTQVCVCVHTCKRET